MTSLSSLQSSKILVRIVYMYIADDPTTYFNDKTSSKCKKYVKLAEGKLFGSWLGLIRIIHPIREVKRDAISLHHLIFLSKLKLTILTSSDLIEEIHPHKYSISAFFSHPIRVPKT